ncbi:MAG: YihY/virulence factor BrkB family protein [Pseudomonadota bacterium]
MNTSRFSKTAILNYLKTDIWRVRMEDLPRRKRFFVKNLRILFLAFRGFADNDCKLRASALTFYSLLSVVPVLAIGFGIAKGFGFQKVLQEELSKYLEAHEGIVERTFEFADSLLEVTKGGWIAGVGVVILIYTAMKLLNHIEDSFNATWEIEKARNWLRKFTDYISIIVVGPILIVLSSTITVFVNTQVKSITEEVAFLGPFSFFLLRLLPFAMIALVLTFSYIILPNTKVNPRSGLMAGLTAGIVYQITEWGYITFQVGVSRYNAIYGSFAALPLFLIWLQISWLIILFGAELAYAHQNFRKYEFKSDSARMSISFRKQVSLFVAHFLVRNFADGSGPSTISGISRALEIPASLVRRVINELVESKIISITQDPGSREPAYQPAQDINRLDIQTILKALEHRGVDKIEIPGHEELEALAEILDQFDNSIAKSSANRLLKDI